MFQWLKNLGGDVSSLEHLVEHFSGMLRDGGQIYDLASNALFGVVPASEVRDQLFSTDQNINRAEQTLRKKLIVHAGVHGRNEFPSCLTLMSVAKDAERIGDYCKNIYDLAATRTIGETDPLYAELKSARDRIADLLLQVEKAFSEQDETQAKAVLQQAEKLEDECDDHVNRLVAAEESQASDITAALSWRYFKRVAGHSKNVATAIFMPVHKLDFFDER